MNTKRLIVLTFILTVASATFAQSERRLSIDDYRDRMKGGWIGQVIGVVWGAPTEFKWNDKVIPEDQVPKWSPEMINNAFGQDDLYVEMTFLRSMEQYGLDVPIRQAGIDFANSEYALWCANNAGRTNLRKGIAPPDSSHPQFNKCPNDIDYQIEADFAGLISPGLPNSVIALGEKFGRLMNYGDGVYGGQFMGGMYAEAFFETDLLKIIDAGLACIPSDSQYAEMVRDMVRWYRESPNEWQKTWALCLQKYRKDPAYQKASNGGIDVKINGAMVLLGLLYGQGDMEKTVVISMRGGYDSDCNPSSAAGVLGTLIGFANLPAHYTKLLQLGTKFSYTAYNVPALLDVCEKLARQIVVQQGGRVEKGADGKECFVIPVRPARPDALSLSWAPGPVANSVFTPEEMAQIKIPIKVYPAGQFADPDPSKRVQKVLDVCFPGWKTSENAPDMNPGYREQVDRTYNVLVTHPPKKGEPVILSKTVKIPEGDPRLTVRVANAQNGNFRLIVKVDGALALETDVGGKTGEFWTYTVGLAPYRGKTVKLELFNQPTGWSNEAAYWGEIAVSGNND
ncbi:MAG TPA: ADP-ribosylglycohydrolase family protein [Kiritimatiellia bacterium]|nr:ADP-ribosylglycohydrolase family protein [Kiritimatiellia bacterium]HPS09009.1 ADP-ribosylglycohydrolase family protein [Kiritimatiellia bacterium]